MTDADEMTDDLLDTEVADDEEFDDTASDDAAVFGDDADSDGSADGEDDTEVALPLDASEDGDDETDGQPAVDLSAIEGLEVDDPVELVDDVEDIDEDAIRDGEFVCTSCHMAKRASALADSDEMLCRDCV